jgi:glycosyltransferase involved in cell wall biosynthesis
VTKPRIAFVVQRAGIDVNGGAEHHCLAVARHLATIWDVEIITTCARDYGTWADYYAPGIEYVDGVAIRRFAVDRPRDPRAFDRLSRRLRAHLRAATTAQAEEWMRAQGPYSTGLFDYLRASAGEFERFFFFTYLYASTYFGLPEVAEKAWLLPLAHDEWMIQLPFWDEFFQRPAGFIFNTPEERDFLKRRFPAARIEGPVVGVGVDLPGNVQPERFRRRYGIEGPFILYLGRIDEAKGVDRLLSQFARYKRFHDDELQLVLIGRAERPLRRRPFVRAIGFVDEETKFDALAAAGALVMPSTLESLSIVLLEAWSVGRPVLVNGASDVLVAQTKRAGGGLSYASAAEFDATLERLLGSEGDELGTAGRLFTEREYRWERIVEHYEAVRLQVPGEAEAKR